MQVPHPHSPMNVDTPICPLPPNSSSMVNAPQLVTLVRSSPRHRQVTSVTLSPRVFEGESDTGIFTDGSKDASSPTKKRTQRRKPREEFTTNDLKALLSAVLNVNPWICTRGESKDRWQEVSVLVKQANACEGGSADTLKNCYDPDKSRRTPGTNSYAPTRYKHQSSVYRISRPDSVTSRLVTFDLIKTHISHRTSPGPRLCLCPSSSHASVTGPA
ncbi:hypothetical protein BU17DRAFT_100828 [Hysterangium stoloniferum]|nr:hypothetical protein BU17DRAFT_100828 [Hysterangium stoloniferum]